ncbi:MAG: AmmeMemoRadiSam system protein B [Nanoarchaeota archaeon]|nr:AmmeMemoRadiSam system protein B [Nanoarchaeota archaeon]MBU1005545.1 AmmeMemoRadiSam system protein B [Nanoarchaeota archaeon]MBU1946604.1 AmmeMemoRadiSam system protein B [Nanoarchaeota archaeon]
MTRKPIVAGMFYADNFNELDSQINDSFNSKFGPWALPLSKRTKNILGIIAPHAGYPYSGPAAAWAYKEIAESKFPNTYIMLGLSHSGYPSCVSLEDWETPFGPIKTDIEFNRTLMANSSLKQNEEAHAQEHSIEVQLPFLQFASKDHLKELKIAPIIISEDIPYEDIAKAIVKTIEQTRRKVTIIISSDFTHYGMNYGFFPFHIEDAKERMYKLDKEAIENIKSLDPKKFLNYIEKTGATICGRTPIAAGIAICKILGAKKAELLNYYTSGDISKDYSSAVGYAAISIG